MVKMNQKYCADEIHKTTNNLSLQLKKDLDEFTLLDEILESIKKNNEAMKKESEALKNENKLLKRENENMKDLLKKFVLARRNKQSDCELKTKKDMNLKISSFSHDKKCPSKSTKKHKEVRRKLFG